MQLFHHSFDGYKKMHNCDTTRQRFCLVSPWLSLVGSREQITVGYGFLACTNVSLPVDDDEPAASIFSLDYKLDYWVQFSSMNNYSIINTVTC